MAGPSFRESGKPSPAKSVSTNGTNACVLPAPGEKKAYVIYDMLWMNPSAEAGLSRLREHSGLEVTGATVSETTGTVLSFMFGDTSMNLTSPIRVSTNKGLMIEVGYTTITYDVVDI